MPYSSRRRSRIPTDTGRRAALATALLVFGAMPWLVDAQGDASHREASHGVGSQGVTPQGVTPQGVRLTLAETDPALPATLARWQLLALRIHYETDQPIRIDARGSVGGTYEPIENGGMSTVDSGSGDVLVWFRSGDTARFDGMTIRAESPSTGRVLATLVVPFDAQWSGVPTTPPPPRAEWVTQMLDANAARGQTDYQRMMARSSAGIGALLAPLLGASVIAYVVLQLVTLVRYRGRRRRLALIPLVPMGCVIIYTLVALGRGSNLFPLVLLFTAPFGALYLLTLVLSGRGARDVA